MIISQGGEGRGERGEVNGKGKERVDRNVQKGM